MIATSDLDEILDHAATDIWRFTGCAILLPSGFVGKWLLESIIHANHRMFTGITPLVGRDCVDDADAIVWGAHSEPPVTDKPLLYLSSGAVYHENQRADIAEEKRRGETIVRALPKGKIARLFSFVGPYLPQHYAAAQILDGKPAENPQLIRSFLYPTDMVIALWAIFARGKPGEAYDVGSFVPTTLGHLQRVTLEEAVRRTLAFNAC